MSGFSGRLQTANGTPDRSTGYGRRLPQGGFQSIDMQYSAEDRCRIIPPSLNTDEYGGGVEDVSNISNEFIEDDNERFMQRETVLNDRNDEPDDNENILEKNNTKYAKDTIIPPKLDMNSRIDISDNLDEND